MAMVRAGLPGWCAAVLAPLALLLLTRTSSAGAGSDAGPRAAGARDTVAVDGVVIALRWIPPGEDVIGRVGIEPCWNDDDVRPWTVRIRNGYWIGETEITRAQWRAVTGADPGEFRECGPDCPVVGISWDEIQAFLEALSRRTGARFRLPTESEWEYAARAGSDGPFDPPCADYTKENCWERVPCLDEIAWYLANSHGSPHPVGHKRPNGWHLYDVHGNAAEWCADWYGRYPDGARDDYRGPAEGRARVVRGGSWANHAGALRVAVRQRVRPDLGQWQIGFRVVREGTGPDR